MGYAVIGKHDGCALMLMQKGANINHMVMLENPKKTDDKNDINYPYLPRQFVRKIQDKSITLFQGLVQVCLQILAYSSQFQSLCSMKISNEI